MQLKYSAESFFQGSKLSNYTIDVSMNIKIMARLSYLIT